MNAEEIKVLAKTTLLRAEELIKERGWRQGDWMGVNDRSLCALQSISEACEESVSDHDYYIIKCSAVLALKCQIHPINYIEGSIPGWNDIEGQSEFDVRETIIKAAMSLQ